MTKVFTKNNLKTHSKMQNSLSFLSLHHQGIPMNLGTLWN